MHDPVTPSSFRPGAPRAEDLAPLLRELEVSSGDLAELDASAPPAAAAAAAEPGSVWCTALDPAAEPAAQVPRLRALCDPHLAPDGALLLAFGPGSRPDEPRLAAWRNALWPWVHVIGHWETRRGRSRLRTLQGRLPLESSAAGDGLTLVARRREHVLSPRATTLKFDRNAQGWNGEPGRPGYGHFRWMRRHVALYGGRPAPGARVLDFGCGTGWVGIEAARAAPGCALRAFDPSPAMTELCRANARASGVADFEARTGFGEAPPYPGPGEEPFDLVLSSGVVSFSPDAERWADGLRAALRPAGTAIVGDLNPLSRGMRHRRASKALLPVRELNALPLERMRALLEARGLQLVASGGYQLTRPLPQVMHWSDTRARGLLSGPLLALNRLLAGRLAPAAFDSWVMRLTAPA
jgi:SAM-dependent methyltransferase